MEVQLHDSLSVREETLLDMHSVLNVMCLITLELLKIQALSEEQLDLDQLVDDNATLSQLLSDPARAQQVVASVGGFHEFVRKKLGDLSANLDPNNNSVLRRHVENLESIFAILKVRAKEIQARAEHPDAWVDHSIAELRRAFVEVFEAIESNSMGAYRIVMDERFKGSGDYLVGLEIRSWRGGTVRMPAVFQDVMRDLMANARKYTPPGGRILAQLTETRDHLIFQVTDNGMGIPPEEIPEVVRFGVRGSNVRERRTNGGGFGLTKAAYVTRKFGGRMWIDSTGVPGDGTRIEIRMPADGGCMALGWPPGSPRN